MADRATPAAGEIRAASAEREAVSDDRTQATVSDDRTQATALFIARRAVEQVARLSRRAPERVVFVEPADDGWLVGVEVVETARIPDTTDILGVLELRLDANGGLISYRRTSRYIRGDVSRGCSP